MLIRCIRTRWFEWLLPNNGTPTSCRLCQRAGASIKSYDPLNASYSTFIGCIGDKMVMNERPNIRARYSYDGIKRNPKSTLRWKRIIVIAICAFITSRVTRLDSMVVKIAQCFQKLSHTWLTYANKYTLPVFFDFQYNVLLLMLTQGGNPIEHICGANFSFI